MNTEQRHENEETPVQNPGQGIRLPAPTATPMLFALGLSLVFAGLVTHWLVSSVGAIVAVAGAYGWWRQVLPHEQHVRVPLQDLELRARPVEARMGAVDHLQLGEGGHRVRLPADMHPYTSGFRGAAAGAVAMALVAMTYGGLFQGSVWFPVNLLASLLVSPPAAGEAALRTFDAANLGIGLFIHASLSLLVGLVYAALLPMLPGRVVLWGGLVGPCLWSAVVWTSLDVLSPEMAQHVQWGWFVVSQVAFGLAAGLVIERAERTQTMQTWPLAVRAGLEAGAGEDG
jgi:hypothetical protein